MCNWKPDNDTDAAKDILADALEAHSDLIVDNPEMPYTSKDMKSGMDVKKLCEPTIVPILETLLKIDPRGGVYGNPDIADAIFKVATRDPRRRLAITKAISRLGHADVKTWAKELAYVWRVMLAHINLKAAAISRNQDEEERKMHPTLLISLYNLITKGPKALPRNPFLDLQDESSSSHCASRPAVANPFIHYRACRKQKSQASDSVSDGEDQCEISSEVEEVALAPPVMIAEGEADQQTPGVVERHAIATHFDTGTKKARRIWSDGKNEEHTEAAKGDGGFIVFKFADGYIYESELANCLLGNISGEKVVCRKRT